MVRVPMAEPSRILDKVGTDIANAGGESRTLMLLRAADLKSAVANQFHHPGGFQRR